MIEHESPTPRIFGFGAFGHGNGVTLPQFTDRTDLTDKTDKMRKKMGHCKERKVRFPVKSTSCLSHHDVWIRAIVRPVRPVRKSRKLVISICNP